MTEMESEKRRFGQRRVIALQDAQFACPSCGSCGNENDHEGYCHWVLSHCSFLHTNNHSILHLAFQVPTCCAQAEQAEKDCAGEGDGMRDVDIV